METVDPTNVRFMVIESALAAALAGLQSKPQVAHHLRALRDQLQAQGLNLPPETFHLLALLEPTSESPDSPVRPHP